MHRKLDALPHAHVTRIVVVHAARVLVVAPVHVARDQVGLHVVAPDERRVDARDVSGEAQLGDWSAVVAELVVQFVSGEDVVTVSWQQQ